MTTPSIACLNGVFQPLDEARVPAMDRGFLFGDGVYEVIPVYSRHPFRLSEHLRRLQGSLDGIRLSNPHTESEWTHLVREVISRNGPDDQSLYLQVTRGADNKRDHAFPAQVQPTVFLMSSPLVTPPESLRVNGVPAITSADIRWLRCDLKATALLANCLLRQMAVDAGCAETILLRDGFLTEGSASSIFVVKDGTLLAPMKNHLMLPGITYDVVLELAAVHGLPFAIRDIPEAELRGADEVWLTSSTKEVLPVTLIDNRPVGNGFPGPQFRRMHAWYQEYKATVMRQPA